MKALRVPAGRVVANCRSVLRRTTSMGVSPSSCRPMKCSASRRRKKLPDTESLTTKDLPSGVCCSRTVKSVRSLGAEEVMTPREAQGSVGEGRRKHFRQPSLAPLREPPEVQVNVVEWWFTRFNTRVSRSSSSPRNGCRRFRGSSNRLRRSRQHPSRGCHRGKCRGQSAARASRVRGSGASYYVHLPSLWDGHLPSAWDGRIGADRLQKEHLIRFPSGGPQVASARELPVGCPNNFAAEHIGIAWKQDRCQRWAPPPRSAAVMLDRPHPPSSQTRGPPDPRVRPPVHRRWSSPGGHRRWRK